MTHGLTPQDFRQVLGQYPTGVVVVTASVPGEPPAAMTIGSFSSVSLGPPLVAFYPNTTSSTWPKIEAQGRFCINVMSAEQEGLCRTLAQKGTDKFRGVAHRPAPSGSPIIEGAVAWIDCEMTRVQLLGDHYLVVGQVTALDTESRDLPLLFFRGGYGRFLPSSLPASDSNLAAFLPVVDVLRRELEDVARVCEAECILAVGLHDEWIVLASAGVASDSRDVRPTRVGRRLPYLAPVGAPLAAWGDPSDVQRWVSPDGDGERVEEGQALLQSVRRRGYVIGTGDIPYAALEHAIDLRTGGVRDRRVLDAMDEVRKTMLAQPSLDALRGELDVHSLSVPKFVADGRVMQLGLSPAADMPMDKLRLCINRLLSASSQCSERLDGSIPDDYPRQSDRTEAWR